MNDKTARQIIVDAATRIRTHKRVCAGGPLHESPYYRRKRDGISFVWDHKAMNLDAMILAEAYLNLHLDKVELKRINDDYRYCPNQDCTKGWYCDLRADGMRVCPVCKTEWKDSDRMENG